MSESLNIRLATDKNAEAWNRLVYDQRGSIFHRYEWKKIFEQSFGYKPHYLIATENNSVVGVLPSCLTGRLLTKRLISLPIADVGGSCAINSQTEDYLLKQLFVFFQESGRQIFSTTTTRDYQSLPSGLKSESPYLEFILKTKPDYEDLFKSFDYSLRKQINKTKRSENIHYEETDFVDCFSNLHDMYAETTFKHNSLPLPKCFFTLVNNHLGDDIKIYIARDQKKPIAFLWSFVWHEAMWLWLFGYEKSYIRSGVSCGIYGYAIEQACQLGLKKIYFGNNPRHSPVIDFKRKWSGEEKALYVISNQLFTPQPSSVQRSTIIKSLQLLPNCLFEPISRGIFTLY